LFQREVRAALKKTDWEISQKKRKNKNISLETKKKRLGELAEAGPVLRISNRIRGRDLSNRKLKSD